MSDNIKNIVDCMKSCLAKDIELSVRQVDRVVNLDIYKNEVGKIEKIVNRDTGDVEIIDN